VLERYNWNYPVTLLEINVQILLNDFWFIRNKNIYHTSSKFLDEQFKLLLNDLFILIDLSLSLRFLFLF
jgi:hypothetical protein